MSWQDEGLIGRMVGRMIRRSVRRSFRAVYWVPPAVVPGAPVIFVANHHGWHDGYLMYHLVTRLGLRSLDWIEEFSVFPLFAKIGGMPYPPGDPMRRAATVKKTIRMMKSESRSLVLFAEGMLHGPPDLLPFGRSVEVVASKVPGISVVPVAIRYDMSVHERPEAYLLLGDPVVPGPDLAVRTRSAVERLLVQSPTTRSKAWQILAKGTTDVNERWDVRRMGRKSR